MIEPGSGRGDERQEARRKTKEREKKCVDVDPLNVLYFFRLVFGGLRTVPAFISELKSLEVLDLRGNNLQIYAPLDFLIKGCPRLRKAGLWHYSSWTPEPSKRSCSRKTWTPKWMTESESGAFLLLFLFVCFV